MSKLLKWWNYVSFWKLFGGILLIMVLCFLCTVIIPNTWCLLPIVILCIIGGIFMRRMIPEILQSIIKEIERD